METTISQQVPPAQSVFSYAGFWRRFVAYIIDQLIMSVVSIIIIMIFVLIVGISLLSEDFNPSPEMLLTIISWCIPIILFFIAAKWLYFAIMESSKGATIGKMVIGIQVTDLNGNRITFGRASGRYFAKIISGLILWIGYIMAGFTQQKQALHDILAKCLVIMK